MSSNVDLPCERENLRAVALFSVVSAAVSTVFVGALSVLFETVLGMAATVAFATAGAALAAWLLRNPLARARAERATGRAAWLGGAVVAVAYVGFAVAFSVAYARVSGEAVTTIIVLVLYFGVFASVILVPIGAFAGAYYAEAPPVA